MKTDKEMISDLMRRKEEYDAKRQARSKRGSYMCIIAAILAVVILEISVPASVFTAANRKGNTPASPAASVDTEPEETTGSDRVKPDDTTSYETRGSAEDSTEITTGKQDSSYLDTRYGYGIISDFYEKDKTERITLTNDEHGRKTWLTKDIIKQYGIDLDTENHPEGYDYAKYKDDIYGYKKKNDVYEIELKLKNTNEWAGDEYLIRIEADEYAEILSENMVKSVFPTVKNPEWYSLKPGDYVSIPLKFRFTGDKKCAEFRVYLFKKSDGNEFHGAHDQITEAEEYFDSGKSMADKAYPNWKDLKGEFNPLYHAASSYYGIRFIEINGYDFLLDSSNSYCSTDLYERAAVYFGETDENGVPLFITGQGPSEYFNPFRIPLISDWPVYNGEYDRGDSNTASPALTSLPTASNGNKGGVIREYSIQLSGIIKWSINDVDISGTDDGLRPANGIQIRIYNNTDNSLLQSTNSTSTGNYSIFFTTPAVEPLNLRVEAWLINDDINIVDVDYNTIRQTICVFNDIPVNAVCSASHNFINGTHDSSTDNTNRAVSAFQALNLSYNYFNNISSSATSLFCGLPVVMQNTGDTYYYSNDVVLILNYKDAFDWDISQHEFGHYVEEMLGIYNFSGFSTHDPLRNLLLDYNKDQAIGLAWDEGLATFFAIDAQRVMNASSLNVPNVGDTHYNDSEEIIISGFDYNTNIDVEAYTDCANFETISSGEATEITIAALLYDLVDGVSSTDADVTSINDAAIWRAIIGDETVTTDGCSTLSQFMVAFHNSTEIGGSEKMNSAFLMRRYNLDPYNISVQNANTSSPTVTWTNPGNAYHNRIRVFDSSYNQIYPSPFLVYQNSFSIPADDWAAIKSGRTYVMIVVECVGALYPMTPGYYSAPVYIFF